MMYQTRAVNVETNSAKAMASLYRKFPKMNATTIRLHINNAGTGVRRST